MFLLITYYTIVIHNVFEGRTTTTDLAYKIHYYTHTHKTQAFMLSFFFQGKHRLKLEYANE